MYQEERMDSILEYLKKNKRISVEEICSIYDVSRDTARRDLVKLEQNGSIVRTHGGALLPTMEKEIKSYKDRLKYSSNEKKEIGKLAASLVKDGDKIIMDTSTTVQACAEFLNIQNCTVVTNSINQADILSNKAGIEIHLLGGKLDKQQGLLYGPSAITMLSNYHVDKAFVGVLGITEKGLYTANDEDGFVMKKMIEQADQVIALADYSKFGKSGFFKYADLSEIDIIITDKKPDDEFMKIIDDSGVIVILTNEMDL